MNGVLKANYGSIMDLTLGLNTEQRYIHVTRKVSLYNCAGKNKIVVNVLRAYSIIFIQVILTNHTNI